MTAPPDEPADFRPRLPPRQQLAAPHKWPVVGETLPAAGPETWTVEIVGLVERPRAWTLAELQEWGEMDFQVDLHCVTRWSKFDVAFRGLPLAELLAAAGPQPEARFVSFVARSPRDHSTSLPLADALALGTFLAWEAEGQPLPSAHGGPLRTVVPGRYFYKSLKWLRRIELLAEDRLGHWEAVAGYHNVADPWLEQRYLAANLSRSEMAALLATRDISGREILGLEAAGRRLEGLRARAAVLRNADFRGAVLHGAVFDGANLTNARFENAALRGASFRNADLDGTDFTGADASEAEFAGASWFGATPPPGIAGPDPQA